MIILKKLSVRNFMSFGNVRQIIDLVKYPMTLIQGINKDKQDNEPEVDIEIYDDTKDMVNNLSEKSSNGSGKSTICSALNYAIYGEAIGNKIKKTNLVNKINRKNMEVSLEFEKDGISYVIERGRSPEYLRFYVNGEDIAQGENVDTQIEIDKIIGMSSELFYQTCLLTASTQNFMEMNAAGQRELIEQLLGVQILSDKAERLKEKVKDIKQVIATETVRLSTVKSANDEIIKRNEEQKQEYSVKLKEFETNRQSNIDLLNSTLSELKKIDIDKELENHKLNEKRKQIIENNSKIADEKTKLNNLIASESKTLESYVNAKNQLLNIDIESEKASHEFNLNIDKTNEDVKKKILDESEKINNTSLLLNESDKKIQTLNIEKSNIEKNIKDNEEKIKSYNNDINKLNEDLKKIELNICPVCGNKLSNSQEKKKEVDEHIAEINNKISELRNNIDSYNKDIENKNKEFSTASEENLKIKSEKNKLNESVSELKSKIIPESSKKITFYKDIKDVYEHSNKISIIDKDIEAKQKELAEYKVNVEKLVEEKVPDVVSTFYQTIEKAMVHSESLKNIESKILEITNQVNPYIDLLKGCETVKLMPYDESLKKSSEDDLAHLEFLIKLLTNKDSFVRKKIIEQNLSFLNMKIKNYLQQMGSLHTIIFNSDLSFDITKFGDSYDFANLSRGEKTSAILALNFSFRDLYELINDSVNVMFVDELVDNGLDKYTASNVVDILKRYSETHKNVFVVSHRKDIQSKMNKVLTVVMELGFSTIQE